MSTQANRRMMILSARFERNAYRFTEALEHIARETARTDGWPTATMGDGGSRSTGAPDARILANVEKRNDLLADREQLRDDLEMWEELAKSQDRMLDRILRTRLAEVVDTGARCSGKIDPLCSNWASTHTHTDGQRDETLCDDCWLSACPHCRARPVDTGRHIEGVPSCEADYRRHMRRNRAA